MTTNLYRKTAELNVIVAGRYHGIPGITQFGRDIEKYVHTPVRQATVMMSDLGVIAGAGLLGFGAAALKAAGHFQTMTQQIAGNTNMLSTAVGKNEINVDKMRTQIKTIAAETGKTMDDIGYGYMHAVNIFGTGNKKLVDSISEWGAKSAAATNASANDTINALGTVINGFTSANDRAKWGVKTLGTHVQSYMDTIHTAVSQGNLTLQDFVGNFSNVAATASLLHIPFTDVAAAMAVMTKEGMPAARIQTQLAGTMLQLVNAAPKARQALLALSQQTGIDVIDTFSQSYLSKYGLGGPNGTMTVLKTALDKASASTRKGTLEILSTILTQRRGIYAGLELTGPLSGQYRTLLATLNKAFSRNLPGFGKKGPTEQMFESYINTMGGQMERIHEKFQVFMINMGNALIPTFNQILKLLSPVLNGLNKFVGNPKNAQGVANFVKMGIAIGGVSLAVRGLVGAFEAGSALTRMNPIMLILTGGIIAYTKWSGFRDFVNGTFSDMLKIAQALSPILKTIGNFMNNSIVSGALGVGAALLGIMIFLPKLVRGFGGMVRSVKNISTGAIGASSHIKDLLHPTTLVKDVWDKLVVNFKDGVKYTSEQAKQMAQLADEAERYARFMESVQNYNKQVFNGTSNNLPHPKHTPLWGNQKHPGPTWERGVPLENQSWFPRNPNLYNPPPPIFQPGLPFPPGGMPQNLPPGPGMPFQPGLPFGSPFVPPPIQGGPWWRSPNGLLFPPGTARTNPPASPPSAPYHNLNLLGFKGLPSGVGGYTSGGPTSPNLLGHYGIKTNNSGFITTSTALGQSTQYSIKQTPSGIYLASGGLPPGVLPGSSVIQSHQGILSVIRPGNLPINNNPLSHFSPIPDINKYTNQGGLYVPPGAALNRSLLFPDFPDFPDFPETEEKPVPIQEPGLVEEPLLKSPKKNPKRSISTHNDGIIGEQERPTRSYAPSPYGDPIRYHFLGKREYGADVSTQMSRLGLTEEDRKYIEDKYSTIMRQGKTSDGVNEHSRKFLNNLALLAQVNDAYGRSGWIPSANPHKPPINVANLAKYYAYEASRPILHPGIINPSEGNEFPPEYSGLELGHTYGNANFNGTTFASGQNRSSFQAIVKRYAGPRILSRHVNDPDIKKQLENLPMYPFPGIQPQDRAENQSAKGYGIDKSIIDELGRENAPYVNRLKFWESQPSGANPAYDSALQKERYYSSLRQAMGLPIYDTSRPRGMTRDLYTFRGPLDKAGETRKYIREILSAEVMTESGQKTAISTKSQGESVRKSIMSGKLDRSAEEYFQKLAKEGETAEEVAQKSFKSLEKTVLMWIRGKKDVDEFTGRIIHLLTSQDSADHELGVQLLRQAKIYATQQVELKAATDYMKHHGPQLEGLSKEAQYQELQSYVSQRYGDSYLKSQKGNTLGANSLRNLINQDLSVLASTAGREAASRFSQEFDSAMGGKQWEHAGTNIILNLVKGIEASGKDVSEASVYIEKRAGDDIESHSPTRKGTDFSLWGKNLVKNFARGMYANSSVAGEASLTINREISNDLNKANQFKAIGERNGLAYSQGLRQGEMMGSGGGTMSGGGPNNTEEGAANLSRWQRTGQFFGRWNNRFMMAGGTASGLAMAAQMLLPQSVQSNPMVSQILNAANAFGMLSMATSMIGGFGGGGGARSGKPGLLSRLFKGGGAAKPGFLSRFFGLGGRGAATLGEAAIGGEAAVTTGTVAAEGTAASLGGRGLLSGILSRGLLGGLLAGGGETSLLSISALLDATGVGLPVGLALAGGTLLGGLALTHRKQVGQAMGWTGDKIGKGLGWSGDKIGKGLGAVGHMLEGPKKALGNFIGWLGHNWKTIGFAILSPFTLLFTTNIGLKVRNWMGGIIHNITRAIIALPREAVRWGENFISSFVKKGIIDNLGQQKTRLWDAFKSTIPFLFKFMSPSPAGDNPQLWGKNFIYSFIHHGIIDNLSRQKSQLWGMFQDVVHFAFKFMSPSPAGDDPKLWGQNFMGSWSQGVQSQKSKLNSVVQNNYNQVKKYLYFNQNGNAMGDVPFNWSRQGMMKSWINGISASQGDTRTASGLITSAFINQQTADSSKYKNSGGKSGTTYANALGSKGGDAANSFSHAFKKKNDASQGFWTSIGNTIGSWIQDGFKGIINIGSLLGDNSSNGTNTGYNGTDYSGGIPSQGFKGNWIPAAGGTFGNGYAGVTSNRAAGFQTWYHGLGIGNGTVYDTDIGTIKKVPTNVVLPGTKNDKWTFLGEVPDPSHEGGIGEKWRAPDGSVMIFWHMGEGANGDPNSNPNGRRYYNPKTHSWQKLQVGGIYHGGQTVGQTGTNEHYNAQGGWHLCVVTNAQGQRELLWLTDVQMGKVKDNVSSQGDSAVNGDGYTLNLPTGDVKANGRITPGMAALFNKYGKKYGLPPALLADIAGSESGFGTRKDAPFMGYMSGPKDPNSQVENAAASIISGARRFHETVGQYILDHYSINQNGSRYVGPGGINYLQHLNTFNNPRDVVTTGKGTTPVYSTNKGAYDNSTGWHDVRNAPLQMGSNAAQNVHLFWNKFPDPSKYVNSPSHWMDSILYWARGGGGKLGTQIDPRIFALAAQIGSRSGLGLPGVKGSEKDIFGLAFGSKPKTAIKLFSERFVADLKKVKDPMQALSDVLSVPISKIKSMMPWLSSISYVKKYIHPDGSQTYSAPSSTNNSTDSPKNKKAPSNPAAFRGHNPAGSIDYGGYYYAYGTDPYMNPKVQDPNAKAIYQENAKNFKQALQNMIDANGGILAVAKNAKLFALAQKDASARAWNEARAQMVDLNIKYSSTKMPHNASTAKWYKSQMQIILDSIKTNTDKYMSSIKNAINAAQKKALGDNLNWDNWFLGLFKNFGIDMAKMLPSDPKALGKEIWSNPTIKSYFDVSRSKVDTQYKIELSNLNDWYDKNAHNSVNNAIYNQAKNTLWLGHQKGMADLTAQQGNMYYEKLLSNNASQEKYWQARMGIAATKESLSTEAGRKNYLYSAHKYYTMQMQDKDWKAAEKYNIAQQEYKAGVFGKVGSKEAKEQLKYAKATYEEAVKTNSMTAWEQMQKARDKANKGSGSGVGRITPVRVIGHCTPAEIASAKAARSAAANTENNKKAHEDAKKHRKQQQEQSKKEEVQRAGFHARWIAAAKSTEEHLKKYNAKQEKQRKEMSRLFGVQNKHLQSMDKTVNKQITSQQKMHSAHMAKVEKQYNLAYQEKQTKEMSRLFGPHNKHLQSMDKAINKQITSQQKMHSAHMAKVEKQYNLAYHSAQIKHQQSIAKNTQDTVKEIRALQAQIKLVVQELKNSKKGGTKEHFDPRYNGMNSGGHIRG